MARISKFESRPLSPRLHPTEAICGYWAGPVSGRQMLVLETYGSDERKQPGKTSQSLQLDALTAAQLKQIIEAAFPDL